MSKLTNKERTDLESIFSLICTKDNDCKLIEFYKQFYKGCHKTVKKIRIKLYKKARRYKPLIK
ncbi:hypothetical protein CFTD6683_03825 [Campylobacter fetus subsp. testudinum]|uniref:Uncharacterized protein n=1 Tax=Campylobacter fetus subsp. testudinum TaxID=1507806 RepID=A0AAX0HDC2_CAMFE|nr:hypothetical protein CFT03427_1072 [Campylobacter fetus subsp. testudinum 03-427]AJB45668.1 hypothetical protein CR44_05455 [Campylobacter fetus subsp. testudinum]ALV65098.1 hypothetical protein CFTSP3_1134 [Campylobacter fetus subsp. testudinum Sp3]AVK81369.1 hypothetical protein C6B32_05885 [Campylobacter fetus subsp. testudinum]OCR88544.1 hypothetical protein CFT12S00416_06115 [Campylobacter fetus subsp. testudinum]